MTKSLVKLIDSALIPAAVMICGKVFGLWFANYVFQLDWAIQTDPNEIFSVKIVYFSLQDRMTATSYSNIIMFSSVFVGFSLILIRALYFHSTHISPRMLARLATRNLLHLIKDSFEIYHQASVWLVILWLCLFAVLINVLIERAYSWTALFSFICTISATVMLLRDVASEISIARKNIHLNA